MNNRDPGWDYHSSRGRRQGWRPSRRTMIPIAVFAGMLSIPVASELLYDNVPLAMLMPLSMSTAEAAGSSTDAARREREMTEEANAIMADASKADIRALVGNRNSKQLREEIRQYSPMIARRDYRAIPQSLKDEIRRRVPERTIQRIKAWVEKNNPSPAQLESYARRELSAAGIEVDEEVARSRQR